MKFYLFSKRCMIKKIFLLLCVLKTYEFMTESERRQIIELIKREVIPAIGCTEPIAVALCVAKAAETLGMRPEKIEVLLFLLDRISTFDLLLYPYVFKKHL